MSEPRPGGAIRRITAAVGTFALALMGVIALSTPASAAIPANIDTSRDGTSSITVHKHAEPAVPGQPGDGSAIPGGLPDPLNDVEFTLYPLTGIDLSTEAGWNTANTISAAINGGATVTVNDPVTSVTIDGETYPVGSGTTQETETNGATTFGALDFGIYVVVEGADNSTPGHNITNKAAPFVVSVPFATGDNTWLYDVHAYPKNSVTGIDKTVDAPEPGSVEDLNRDLVRWEISLEIPRLPAGETLTEVELVDTIDATELAFVATPPTGVTGNSYKVLNSSGIELTVPDGSFTWSPEPPSGTTLTLAATADGLTWLQNNAQGGKVVASVLTRLMTADVDVTNNVAGNINDTTVTTMKKAPTGELEIFKWANTDPEEDTVTGLSGAKFALYTSLADAQSNLVADRVVVGGVSEFGPTDTNGYLMISALKPGTYWLVETVAPTGYQLDQTPLEVLIVAGETVRPSENDPEGSNYVDIENEQVPPWELPLTGSSGVLVFGLAGGALLAIAIGSAILAGRRKRARV
ncbi:MAG: SpaH/EbpB family LPXTG-anchored major pilin [Leucobacter sp.]